MDSTLSTYIYPTAMDQSEMSNSNAPLPLPELHKTVNGWSGKCDQFRVVDNVINIKISDANSNRAPSQAQRERRVDDEGIFSQHVQLAQGDHLYQLWMHKIGPYLADWVLGKGRHVSPEWKLMKFPEGYTLWVHKKGVETDPANPRMDTYLHGAPHLGPATAGRTHSEQLAPSVFRSPMEFVEHAIWLMRGKVGQCRCKYCIPGQEQLDINARLDREDPGDGEGVGADGGDSGSGGGHASSTSRRRRTGPRRPRRAGRDRSPPIMAKDYRVGNQPSAPAPGPA